MFAELSGLSRTEAYSIFLPMSIVSASTNLIAGWLSDRMELRYLLSTMMGFLVIAGWGLINLDSLWGRSAAIGGMGVAGGLFACLTIVVWPRFYGRKHLGAITGLNMGSLVFASAIGPFAFSWMRSWTGRYDVAIWSGIVFALILGLGSFKAQNPQKLLKSSTA